MFLLVVCALAIDWVGADANSRLEMTMGSLLNVVAFKFATASMLPEKSLLSRGERYFLLVLVYHTLLVVKIVIMYQLTRWSEALGSLVDWWASLGLLACWVTTHFAIVAMPSVFLENTKSLFRAPAEDGRVESWLHERSYVRKMQRDLFQPASGSQAPVPAGVVGAEPRRWLQCFPMCFPFGHRRGAASGLAVRPSPAVSGRSSPSRSP